MRKNSVSIFALLLGTVVGATLTLLFARTKGEEVRSTLSYRVKNYVEKLQELIKVLSHTKTAASSQAKAAGQEVIEGTIQKAKRLLQDANELAAQLD